MRFGRLAAVVLAGLLLGADTADVEYQGRPVHEWAELLQSSDVTIRRATAKSVMTAGPGADLLIPALGNALNDDDADVRLAAARALATFSTSFRQAIPYLIEAFKSGDSTVRLVAIEGAMHIGVRGPTICTVGPSGLEDRPFVALPREVPIALTEVLADDEDARVRAKAAEVLHVFARRYTSDRNDRDWFLQVAASPLVEALRDDAHAVRRNAVDALGVIRAKAAIPALCELLEDPNIDLRRHTALALTAIKPMPGITIPAIVEAFANSENSETRLQAIRALRRNAGLVNDHARSEEHLLSDREAFFSMMIPALEYPEFLVRKEAAATFSHFGTAARPAIPVLIRVVEARGSEAQSAAWALARIGEEALVAVPALVELLINDKYRRREVPKVLQELGPEATSSAVTLLVGAVRDEREAQQLENIVDAFIAMGPD